VEMYPGTIMEMAAPKLTASRSIASDTVEASSGSPAATAYSIALSTSFEYTGSPERPACKNGMERSGVIS
jgi:hypothetical protein